jgi:hypothetical protein
VASLSFLFSGKGFDYGWAVLHTPDVPILSVLALRVKRKSKENGKYYFTKTYTYL